MATEDTVQSAVFQIELGRGKRVAQAILIALLAVTLGLLYTAGQFRGLEKRESIDMAQVARNLARGEGYTTHMVRPLSLWHQKTVVGRSDPQLMQHPDLYNPPLYPMLLAALFKTCPPGIFELKPGETILSAERWVILPLNQFFLLATLCLVYVWAKQVFDRRTAVTAMLLLLASDTLWSYSISGLPTNLLMLLVLLALYCLYVVDRRLNPTEPTGESAPVVMGTGDKVLVLSSAVLVGLCFLTRYLAGVLVVPLALYAASVLRGRRGAMWAVVYVAVFAAVIAPWLIRNVSVSHSLVGVAKYDWIDRSGGLSGDALQRSFKPDLDNAYAPRSLAGKFVSGLRKNLTESFRDTASDYLVFFFGVGLMYGFRRRDTMRLRGALVGCLLAGLLAMALIGSPVETSSPAIHGGNLFVVFLPVLAIYGVAFFYLLLDRIPFRIRLTQGLTIAVFAAVNVAPMAFTLLRSRQGAFPYPPYCGPYTRAVASFFEPKEIGVTDMPWSIAWYGDRRAVWLPTMVDDFYELNDFVAPTPGFAFILLTPYMLNQRFQTDLQFGEFKDWSGVLAGRIPSKFPLKAMTAIPPENQQFLIADRPRWENRKPLTDVLEPERKTGQTNAPATKTPAATEPAAP